MNLYLRLPWLFTLVFFASTANGTLNVVVDAGHGGADAGAQRQDLKESEVTLKIAKKLAERIQEDSKFKAYLTRSEDVAVDLKDRIEFAKQVQADLFLSIHANASSDPRAKGAEFYFQNQMELSETNAYLAHQENQLISETQGPTDRSVTPPHWPASLKTLFIDLLDQSRIKKSFLLSKSLRETWQGEKKPKSLSLKQAPFQVVSRTDIPSTLVEVGFLTNPTDYKNLKNENYLDQIVESLLNGLNEYRIRSQDF